MTITKIFGFVVSAAIGLIGVNTAKATTFSDNFNSGPSSAWDNNLGGWTTANGSYFAQNPSVYPSAHSLVTGYAWSDFSVNVDVINPADGTNRAGGIWLRAANDGPAGTPGDLNGNIGVSGVLFAWAHSPLDMYWHVVLPGQTCCPTSYGYWPNLVQFGPATGPFSVRIEVKGNLYSAYVNGVLITSLVDNNFTSGQVGLYDGDLAGLQRFDNFSVSAVPLPAALPLFATGLGVLGLLGWRRKRKAAALAA